MFSICVTVKNRHRLFARCVHQLAACDLRGCELVVADWGSTDCPDTRWLSHALENTGITLTTVRLPGDVTFSRGMGLNRAVRPAMHDSLFFIDTDMLIPQSVFEHAKAALSAGKAYFPICWSYTDAKHTKGRWRVNGRGVCAVSRQIYHAAGRWPEIMQWGSEDKLFYEAVAKLVPIVRNNEEGLYHQWHPQLNSYRPPT